MEHIFSTGVTMCRQVVQEVFLTCISDFHAVSEYTMKTDPTLNFSILYRVDDINKEYSTVSTFITQFLDSISSKFRKDIDVFIVHFPVAPP